MRPSSGILPSYLVHAGFLLGCFSTLKKDVIRSSETSLYIRITRRYITEDGNIHEYHCDDDNSYMFQVIPKAAEQPTCHHQSERQVVDCHIHTKITTDFLHKQLEF